MTIRVFHHPTIRTGLPGGVVQALAVDGEEIVAAGTLEQVREAVGAAAPVVELDGVCVLPGFYDAHIHTASLARDLTSVDLRGTASLEEALERVRTFREGVPEGAWLLGGRWDSNRWRVPRQPDRDALDTVCPDRPAVLRSVDGHTVWVNTAALRAAGIDDDTPDPIGGQIVRDEHGRATGILREEAGAGIRRQAEASLTDDLSVGLAPAQEHLLSVGLTSVHDIDGEDCRAAYLRLREEGKLKLRVHKAIPVTALETAIQERRTTGDGDDWFGTGPVKLFSDGALGSHTCHMREPFRGDDGNTGIAVTPADELRRLARLAAGAGIAVATHAIGDRAVETVLDVYESIAGSGAFGLRHRVEHSQHMASDDIVRMARLGVVASMQPTHCTSDIDLVDDLLGDRDIVSYGWRSVLNAGAPLAFGSDCPVEDPNPFHGVYAAVTRMRADGTPAGGWQPEQRLAAAEAVTAYTLGSAYAAGQEQRKGTLIPGRLADFVVVDTDPLTADPADIRGTKVLQTVVGGKTMWRL